MQISVIPESDQKILSVMFGAKLPSISIRKPMEKLKFYQIPVRSHSLFPVF